MLEGPCSRADKTVVEAVTSQGGKGEQGALRIFQVPDLVQGGGILPAPEGSEDPSPEEDPAAAHPSHSQQTWINFPGSSRQSLPAARSRTFLGLCGVSASCMDRALDLKLRPAVQGKPVSLSEPHL